MTVSRRGLATAGRIARRRPAASRCWRRAARRCKVAALPPVDSRMPVHPADVDDATHPEPAAAESRWTALAAAMARAVRRQCPAWLRDHAQDIAQMALAKVMAAEQGREGNRPLTSFYLHRAAHSALVDEIRRRKRRPEVSLEDGTADGGPATTVEPTAAGNPERSASFG